MPLSPLEIKLNDLFSRYANTRNDEDQKSLTAIIREKLHSRDENIQLDISGRIIEQNNDAKIIIRGLDLSELDLRNIHFSNMEFHQVKFNKSDLTATLFSGKDRKNLMIVMGSNFNQANCILTNFNNVDLRKSTFEGTEFKDPSFNHYFAVKTHGPRDENNINTQKNSDEPEAKKNETNARGQ